LQIFFCFDKSDFFLIIQYLFGQYKYIIGIQYQVKYGIDKKVQCRKGRKKFSA